MTPGLLMLLAAGLAAILSGAWCGPVNAAGKAGTGAPARPAKRSPPPSSAEASSSNPVVATVNGRAIREDHVRNALAMLRADRPELAEVLRNPVESRVFRQNLLQQLITKELLLAEAGKLSIPDRKARIDDAYRRMVQAAGSERELWDDLRASGVSREWFMGEIERNVAIEHFVDVTIRPDVTITDAAVRDHYDRQKRRFAQQELARASHLLIRLARNASEADRQASRKVAEELLHRARRGEDFGALARQYSEDGATKRRGGDLGFISRGTMAPELEEAVFALKPGQLSDVVETGFGFHIIRCTDRMEGRRATYEEVREEIRVRLREAEVRRRLEEFVKKIRERAKITVAMH